MKIDGAERFEVIPPDVTFLVVPASAWPASPKVLGFGVVIFERRERLREDFERDILRYLDNPKHSKYFRDTSKQNNA